jgi:hypothetical protein
MKYKGIIKKSRTYDHTAVSQMIDFALPVYILYTPEQLGLTVTTYAVIRIGLNALAGFLRHKTTGPVGVGKDT